MEKIYRVQMNGSGMPNFSTAVEIDTDISEYSDKLWRNAYERGEADRPQGDWLKFGLGRGTRILFCTNCKRRIEVPLSQGDSNYDFCPNCGAHMAVKGADDE